VARRVRHVGARLREAVGDAVAVVVEPVAHLGLRAGAGALAPHAGAARPGARRADADARAARPLQILVDRAVTVVVRVVAELDGAGEARARALVDQAVAVVVLAVARLGGRGAAKVRDLAGDAGAGGVADQLAGALADALLAVVAGLPLVREILVDRVVAIVV